jgi:hypothetical protein
VPARTFRLYTRGMNEAFFAELSAWLMQAGLAGTSETNIVSGFCDRCVAAGLPLARTLVLIDTLHPVHEGRLFRWGFGPPNLQYSTMAVPAQRRLPRLASILRTFRRPSAGDTAHSSECYKPATRFCAGP